MYKNKPETKSMETSHKAINVRQTGPSTEKYVYRMKELRWYETMAAK